MPTVEERLAALEARVDAMSDVRNLIAELRADMNTRFNDVNARFTEVNGRIGSLDAKIDRHFVWLVGMMVTGFITVIGALLGGIAR